MLKAHLDQQDAECTDQHPDRPPDTLFCRPSGVPWSPDTVTHYFKRMANSVGITLSLKHLWHTQASILLQKGVHLKIVQERLSHSSIAVTADIYSAIIPRPERAAADTFEEALGKGRQNKDSWISLNPM